MSLGNQMIMFEEEHRQIQVACDLLQKASNAIAVLVVGKDGQEIARSGETAHLDVTSLSSLFAGNVAATGAIAKLLQEKEFSGQFHEGEKTSIHISLVATRAILIVVFDQRSSLGLVRLRVKKAAETLTAAFDSAVRKQSQGGAKTQVFGEITDEDIDNLFNE